MDYSGWQKLVQLDCMKFSFLHVLKTTLLERFKVNLYVECVIAREAGLLLPGVWVGRCGSGGANPHKFSSAAGENGEVSPSRGLLSQSTDYQRGEPGP